LARSLAESSAVRSHDPEAYKWIALSNTTLGVLMASLNANIILISLPPIFRGININPLAPGQTGYLLWVLMGYMVVTATLLVSFGRLSDMYGRVRLYNLGFAIFTAGSLLLFLLPNAGSTGALELIIFRLVQGVGAGFLFSNSTAILTDSFPPHERGMAMGLNQIAAIAGSLVGLILGGLLAAIHWRAVFLVSVPVGLFGTVWAYLKLKEAGSIRTRQKLDLIGNTDFALGLTLLLVALTYGIMPYGSSPMGWRNPLVITGIIVGLLLLVAFVFIELRAADPMFRMSLFRIRMFAAGNLSGFLASLARGGLMFMLIIWLQGIWLPLHGYSFQRTPLWSGIYMSPMMAGFLVMGPLSGWLSDRFGSRGFATGGMVLTVAGFALLTILPANFTYGSFLIILILMGLGMGMFAAPNTTAIMNSVPPQHRGVASGMRATIQNSGSLLSMALFFTIVIIGLSHSLPSVMYHGLVTAGIPAPAARHMADLPPTGALFAAFLGYNPISQLIPPDVLAHLAPVTRQTILGKDFFPGIMAPALMSSLKLAFYISAAMSAVAALASCLRGGKYIYTEE